MCHIDSFEDDPMLMEPLQSIAPFWVSLKVWRLNGKMWSTMIDCFFSPFVQLSHFRAASITFLQMLDKRRWGAWCPGHEGVDCSIMCSNWSHRCLGRNCTHYLQVEKETHDSSIMFSRIVFDILMQYVWMFVDNGKLKWPSQLWGVPMAVSLPSQVFHACFSMSG